MEKPIFNTILNRIKKDVSSFHTPGHKGNYINSYYKTLFANLEKFDLTELPDTDNLLNPQEIILETEKKAAKLFNAKLSLFSTFGCTLCIQTMIKLATYKSKKLIVHRNLHKSAINAMALLDITPVWLYEEGTAYFPETAQINLDCLEDLIKSNQDAAAVYITSPNYYGTMQDIDKIADLCHKYGLFLLVDNAHGSHLYFTSDNTKSALCKADMLACSLHKTLPVLTGGAVLNINNPIFLEYAQEAMNLFSGTSPSYPILSSIDLCIDYISNNKNIFKATIQKVDNIKKTAHSKGFSVLTGVLYDPMRIAISTRNMKITGYYLADEMRNSGIEPEFADLYNVVLIPTVSSSKKDFKRLEDFFCNINIDFEPNFKVTNISAFSAKKKMELREALLSPFKTVNTENAIGEISFECVCNYPPGIPLILPGEEINEDTVLNCLSQGIKKVKVVI